MRAGNPIESLAESLYRATLVVLPDVEYEHQSPQQRRNGEAPTIKKRRPYDDEVECVHFVQMWSSTALGFGGIGGAAMTRAYTTIVSMNNIYAVFLAGRFAYMVNRTTAFAEDITKMQIMSVAEAKEKYDVIKTFEDER